MSGWSSDEAIEAFACWQRGQNFAGRTITRRSVSLRSLARSVAPLSLLEVDALAIEEWVQRSGSPATRRAYLSDAARFYRWAVRRRLVAVDPTLELERPRAPRSLPRPFTPAEVAAMLTAADARLRVMIAIAAFAGLRRAEVCALDWADMVLEGEFPTITVRAGKGGHDRTVPAHPVLVGALRAWAPPASGASVGGPVFPGVRHGAGRGMSPATLHGQFSRLCRLLGIEPAHFHRLRHFFGTVAAEVSGGDLPAVAALMGHASPATTAGYVALRPTRLAEIVNGFQLDTGRHLRAVAS